jgi:predicted dehydrogenase
MDPIRVALIGLGTVADYHLQALAHMPEAFQVVAGADLQPRKAEKLPAEASFYADFQQLLREQPLDAAVITLPNQLHLSATKTALMALPCVMVEKPAVLNRQEWSELEQTYQNHQALLYTSFHARFASDLLWWEEHGASLGLGWPTGFSSAFYDPYVQDGRLDPAAESLSGSWIDSGVNALSVVFALFPELRYQGHTLDIQPEIHNQDIAATYRFTVSDATGNKGAAVIRTNWQLGKNYKATELTFEDASIRIILNHSRQSVILQQDGKEKILADLSNSGPRLVNHYRGVYADFHKNILAGTDNFAFSRKVHNALFSKV